jgi:DNA-directed RNA polymerase specialized sigma24 family protein
MEENDQRQDSGIGSLIAKARRDPAALRELLAWLCRERETFLSNELRDRGVQDRNLPDAVQDVLEVVGQQFPQFRGNSVAGFMLWVIRIIQTVARRYRRIQREILGSALTGEDPNDPDYEPPLEFLDPAADLHMQTVIGVDIMKALDQLPVKQGEAWILRDKDRREFADVAKHLGRSLKKTKELIYMARRTMRVYLTLHSLVIDAYLDMRGVTPATTQPLVKRDANHPHISRDPSSPAPRQPVEAWLDLHNYGYSDAVGVCVCLHLGKKALGRQIVNVPLHDTVRVRGFSQWTMQQNSPAINVTLMYNRQDVRRQFVIGG